MLYFYFAVKLKLNSKTMSKEKRPEWHGHSKVIANICGCSTTAVSKILNGKEEEVTTNQELITRVKQVAAQMILRDRNILLQKADVKQKIAQQLTGA